MKSTSSKTSSKGSSRASSKKSKKSQKSKSSVAGKRRTNKMAPRPKWNSNNQLTIEPDSYANSLSSSFSDFSEKPKPKKQRAKKGSSAGSKSTKKGKKNILYDSSSENSLPGNEVSDKLKNRPPVISPDVVPNDIFKNVDLPIPEQFVSDAAVVPVPEGIHPQEAFELPPKQRLPGTPPAKKGFSMCGCLDRLCGKRPEEDDVIQAQPERKLRANDRAYNAEFKYADNYIKTSKYNVLTFLPQNLFEQFLRIANFYFLLLMILQFIPIISSIAWYTTAIPLCIVLAFTALKDGYDDVQRHISDRNVNNRKSYVVRDGRLVEEHWSNVRVGDVIRMMSNQFVAADLFLLSTSEPHGLCYIETKELDGETNLKNRASLPETQEMGDDLDRISGFDGDISCEAPNNKLDRFNGQITWQNKTYPMTNDQILLRGCILKNTRWCYGVVIFAGRDTKLMMNSGKTKLKRTSLDRFLNVLILGIVLFLFAMCLICTILCGVWEWTTGRYFTEYLPWDKSIPDSDSYDKGSKQISVISFLMFFSYIILLNTVVPISLYVSVEIIRFVHSMWINNDNKMYFENGPNSVQAKAHTTTLNEELGQVQYVFSDKTGTLTQNIMTFNKATINGIRYGDAIDNKGNYIEINDSTPTVDFSWNAHYEPTFRFYDQNLLDSTRKGSVEVTEFWRLLALCHTVMPERENGRLIYQAQSPDEAALTAAARNFGFVFRSRTPQSITIEVNGKEEVYELLCILDFNNERKRMSVIVRNSKNEIKLYCKGADMMIMERLKSNTSRLLLDATNQHLSAFAADGLRTLCLAYKDITKEYFEDWINRQKEAAVDMFNREQKLDQIYEEIEKDLILLGATAIEDKLQDGVPEAIARLAAANIKIWVLTGDKTETAINIAYSCRLLTDDMSDIMVVDGSTYQEVEVQLKDTWRVFDQALNRRRHTPKKTLAVERYINDVIRMLEEAESKGDYRPLRQPPRPQTSTARSTGRPMIEIETVHSEGQHNNLFLRPNDSSIQVSPTAPRESPTSNEGGTGGVALVINGDSLGFALSSKLERTFLEIACKCQAVICCRVTPLQKAQVVDLVKRNKKAVTLSIGDGANDVSMIKTAHIGVGISGQEGMQAVLASDYSIGQFKYLERLLLVHGRWSYIRMSKFLRYFFYKNFAFTLTHFWYSFFCGYSAQTVFDAVLIACYNLFFTALPVLAMGSLDQDVDDETSLRYPTLYLPGQYNLMFNMRIFIYSVLHGIVSSVVIFFVPYGALYQASDHSGRDMNDYPALAFTTFTALIVVVTAQIAFDTAYWTAITHVVIWGSLAFYFGLAIVFYEGSLIVDDIVSTITKLFRVTGWDESLPFSFLSKSSSAPSFGIAFRVMSTSQFWFSILLVCVILLMPVMLNRFFWFDVHPTFSDRLRVRNKLRPVSAKKTKEEKKSAFKRTPATRRSVRGSLRSGYAFSHSQGFGDLILKGKLFKNIDQIRGRSPRPGSSKLSPVAEDSSGVAMRTPFPPSSVPGSVPENSGEFAMRSHLPSTSTETTFPVTTSRQFRPKAARQVGETQRSPHHMIVNQDSEYSIDGMMPYPGQPTLYEGVQITGDGRPITTKRKANGGRRPETEDSDDETYVERL